MIDDILLQEICSLNEKLKILTKIVKYYEPNLDKSLLYHNIGTCDYQEYIKGFEGEDIDYQPEDV